MPFKDISTHTDSDPPDVALYYHERTKHHYHQFARSMGYLDWANHPDPFRRYVGSELISLPLIKEDDSPPYADIFEPGRVTVQPVSKRTISQFLEYSLALSAWKEFQGSRWALRANPSSGNLHPTEGYLLLGSLAGLQPRPAVYHYAPREHALEKRASISAFEIEFVSATETTTKPQTNNTTRHFILCTRFPSR